MNRTAARRPASAAHPRGADPSFARLGGAALLGLLSLGGVAQADTGRVIIPTVPAGTGVTAPIAQGFESQLRARVAALAPALLDPGATATAMQAAQFKVGCATDACGEALGKAADARFVLNATVVNSDEIYTVELGLFDRAIGKRTTAKEVCELCTVEEVDGTIGKATAKLAEALKAPAPKVVPVVKTPVAAAPVALKVETTPPGAEVFLDGQRIGETPYTGTVAAGPHRLRVVKANFLADESEIRVSDRPITVQLALLADPDVLPVEDPESPEVPVAGALGAPAVAAAAPVSSERRLTGVAVGMAVGGAVLAGVGTWMVALDGDITCDDGRSRAECPTVYNTKYVGVAGLGLGAGLIGAAIATLVLDGGPGTTAAVAPTGDGGAMVQWGGRF